MRLGPGFGCPRRAVGSSFGSVRGMDSPWIDLVRLRTCADEGRCGSSLVRDCQDPASQATGYPPGWDAGSRVLPICVASSVS